MILTSNIIIRIITGQVTSGAAITFGFIESLLELYLETFHLRFSSEQDLDHLLSSEQDHRFSWRPISASWSLSQLPSPSPCSLTSPPTTTLNHFLPPRPPPPITPTRPTSTHDSSVTSVGFCFLGYAIAYTLFTILAGVITDSKIKVKTKLRMALIIKLILSF